MGKKMILILAILALVWLAFAACTEGAPIEPISSPEPTPVETPEPEETPCPEVDDAELYTLQGPFADEFGLTIVQLWDGNNALLETLDVIHTLDYNLVRTARGSALPEEDWGLSLLIQTEAPLYDFSVIAVANDFIADVPGTIFIPLAFLGEIDVLNPNEGFLITNYGGLGTLFWSGVSFLDEIGVRRYFTMGQDQGGWMEPNIWDPDILDLFENGELQVALMSDGGGVREHFIITLAENGPFNPDIWWDENWPQFSSFLLIPFQNRTDALPSDWEPWW